MSFIGTFKGLINDTVARIVRVDAATHVLKTMEYEHAKRHNGSSFSWIDVVDLALNNVRDIQITTPNTDKWAHFTFSLEVESETEWFLYRNVNIILPGTAYIPENANENSGTASVLVMAYIDNASVADANADTAVAAATERYHGIIGAGKDGGTYIHAHELILKQNEDYTLRFIANTAGYVVYHLDWYEHVNKD